MSMVVTFHWNMDLIDDIGDLYGELHSDSFYLRCRGRFPQIFVYTQPLYISPDLFFLVNIRGLMRVFRDSPAEFRARRLLAARALWRGKSRECAREIIEFARNLDPKTDDERAFKDLIARDTSPERILSGLRGIRQAFSAWLAAIEPRPEYVPELIRAVEEGRSTDETLYAIKHSTDERAVRFVKSCNEKDK